MVLMVTSFTTGAKFLVESTPGIWSYPFATSRARKTPFFFRLNTHLLPSRCIPGGRSFFFICSQTSLFFISVNSFVMPPRQPFLPFFGIRGKVSVIEPRRVHCSRKDRKKCKLWKQSCFFFFEHFFNILPFRFGVVFNLHLVVVSIGGAIDNRVVIGM